MTDASNKPIRFPLGQVCVTANAQLRLTAADIAEGLRRHASGDWGDLVDDDARQNNSAVAKGCGRIFSAYGSGNRRFWVITEADRSATTILLPMDY